MAAIPNEFFTPESMLTLAGATLMTTVVTNSCQHAFSWNPKWFGLIIALIIAFVGVMLTDNPTATNYFMGLFNGFLIYASATGIMQMAGTPSPQPDPTRSAGTPKRKFSQKWY